MADFEMLVAEFSLGGKDEKKEGGKKKPKEKKEILGGGGVLGSPKRSPQEI